MSVVWTTLAIIALLIPGIFFFVGLATYERLSREIIRSGVVSEVALATMVAIVLHTVCLSLLGAFGFRLSSFLSPLVEYDSVSHAEIVLRLSRKLIPVVIYLVTTAAVGFAVGAIVATGIVKGWLRFLAKHKWIYDIVDRDRNGGIVTAFVMTKTIEDGKVLMYRGRLHEVFLLTGGKISYVILKNSARFYMTFGTEAPVMGKQLDLFDGGSTGRRMWDYLLIEEAISPTSFSIPAWKQSEPRTKACRPCRKLSERNGFPKVTGQASANCLFTLLPRLRR